MPTETPPCSEADVECLDGVSRVVTCLSVAPLRLLVPESGTAAAWIVQSSYGGGLVQGDRVRLRFRCGPNARVLLGTQANGRVYRHLDAATARQETDGSVEAGGLAVVFPDPLVLHTESRLTQRQHWNVSAGGSLVLGDWFQCGRSDSGERFAYALWENETSLSIAGKLAVLDRFRSEPAHEEPQATGRFAGYSLMLNLYVLGPVATALADALSPLANIEELRQVPSAPVAQPNLRCALSRLENTEGFVLRALTRTREHFDPLIEALFAHLAASALLGFNPLARKY